MDLVQNPAPTQSQPTAQPAASQQQPGIPLPPAQSKQKGNAIVLGIIAIVTLIFGGSIIFMSQRNANPPTSITTTPQTTTNATAGEETTSSQNSTEDEEQTLESIDTNASDSSDFEDVQKDINQL